VKTAITAAEEEAFPYREAGRKAEVETHAEAVERVCRNYWPAIYHAVRAKGFHHEEAQDIVQEFVAGFVLHDEADARDSAGVPFRTRIFRGLRDFLRRHRREENCLRRGGRQNFVPLDDTPVEDQPVTEAPPDEVYDREWASTLMLRATATLREDYESCGRGLLFDLIRPALTGRDLPVLCTTIARVADLPASQVSVELQHARRRLGAVLRDEVAATVLWEREVDDELRYVLTVLACGQ
jgi:RNA polymerase sigma-70 factor (ECF subfamily)